MSDQNREDHTNIWKMYMKTLTKRMIGMKTDEIIRKAISDYYFEKGQPEPPWIQKKDPQWWIDYLDDLENGS